MQSFSKTMRYLAGVFTGCIVTYCFLQSYMPLEIQRFPDSSLRDFHEPESLRDFHEPEQKSAIGEESKVAQNSLRPPTPEENQVRICCWIMTNPKNLEKKASFVQATWARRCNKSVFISSETNTTFPTVGIDVSEGRSHLTEKTLGGYHYVYHHHLDDCDWFFKGDDDTYLVVENLRRFLVAYDTNKPIYFGHHFKTIIKQGYSSGGSGMVLSKEALRRFGKEGHDPKVCRQSGTAGDAALGECMQTLGVKLLNSTDAEGKSTFHCLAPYNHISGKYPAWYYKYDANGAHKGIDSMSHHPISFHYVPGYKQLELDFFLYHAKVSNDNY